MTPIPLDQIRLDWRSHRSALWWFGLSLRKPDRFLDSVSLAESWGGARALLRILAHALPYLLVVTALGRWFLFGALGLGHDAGTSSSLWSRVGHGYGALVGLGIGVTFGVAFVVLPFAADLSVRLFRGKASVVEIPRLVGLVIALAMRIGLPSAISIGLIHGMAEGLAEATAVGLTGGAVAALTFAPSLWISRGFSEAPVVWLINAVTRAMFWSTAGSFVAQLEGVTPRFTALLAGGIAGVAVEYRLIYVPLHLLLVWPLPKARYYLRHPVAWDDCCGAGFPGLSQLLVSYSELNPSAGHAEIDRLIDHYPGQRGQALLARTELIAREAGRATDLARLDEVVAALPQGKRGYLTETRRLREMVQAISASAVRLAAVTRPYLREPQAALLVKEIELFEQQIAGFHQPLAREFRSAARKWLEVARTQRTAVQAVTAREPVGQVFRAGDPVDRDQEAFVPRDGVFGELERQVLLATGCPGLLLYGRRRTGKSTVLKNVASFLPPRVTVLSISMQRAEAFTSLPNWLGLFARTASEILPNVAPPGDPPTGLVDLERYLSTLDRKLAAEDRRLLVALDEYENLDRKIGEGVFSEDLLSVLRESIQSHRRIIWAFAGSHAIEELTNAEWTSYLVSVRTVEIPMFTFAETRLLLTEPMKHSSLWGTGDASRPRFEPGFWGEGGIERIHAETNGWPHLVQLLAERLVDRVNDTGALRASPELHEQALDLAVERGHNTFLELLQKESTLVGEWDYLLAFKRHDEQPPPDDEAIARSLHRRLLVTEDPDRWRLAVPLMQRWLRLRG